MDLGVTGLRLLVVARTPNDAREWRAALSEHGWDVRGARSIREAVRLVASGRFDALLVDAEVWAEQPGLRSAAEANPPLAVCLVERDGATPVGAATLTPDLFRSPGVARIVTEAVRTQRARHRRRTLLRWLERESQSDPVTGLVNARAFEHELHDLCREARERGASVGLILLELVGLGILGEVNGPAAAEDALRRAGRLVAANVRAVDLAGRVGRDRLAIAVSDADEDLVRRIARRIAHAFERQAMEGAIPPLMVNVAVAVGSPDAPAALRRRAEELLEGEQRAPVLLSSFMTVPPDGGPSVA